MVFVIIRLIATHINTSLGSYGYKKKCRLAKKYLLVSDFVERHKYELMNKIICPVKLLHFANNNNCIAKIDIIKVKLMTQLVFSIQKLITYFFIKQIYWLLHLKGWRANVFTIDYYLLKETLYEKNQFKGVS